VARALDAVDVLPPTGSRSDLEVFVRSIDRAVALLRDAQPEQARVLLEGAIAFFPDNVLARQLLALSLLRTGQLERALVIYESLLHERPRCAAARVNVAVVLLKLGRPFAARPLLEDVIHATPLHGRAWGYLGATLEQVGLLREAHAAFLAGAHTLAAEKLRERHPCSFSSAATTSSSDISEVPLASIVTSSSASPRSGPTIPHLQAALTSLVATWERTP
jgi:tetratricopeptide (TPR) repeat protein